MDERLHVLIVAAEHEADDPLAHRLEKEGFASVRVVGLTAALHELATRDVALVVLDGDSAGGLQRVRAESGVPVIVIAAQTREADRVRALELGADDIVPKPFSPAELVARIRAVLRRSGVAQTRTIEIGDLLLDPAARRVTKRGHPLALGPRLFDLLHVLMQSAGTVVRRERLMNEVWKGRWGSTKTLDVHITWLRARIEDDPSRPRYITTLRGTGFRFASPAELADAV